MFFFFSTMYLILFFFFFQAEDGIRDGRVTGVQTCALPISPGHRVDVEQLAGEVGVPRRRRREQAQLDRAGHLDWPFQYRGAVDQDVIAHLDGTLIAPPMALAPGRMTWPVTVGTGRNGLSRYVSGGSRPGGWADSVPSP